jgi:membrane fusion protein, copper/silver efflux system
MNTRKNIVIIIFGCLLFGAIFGWIIRGGGEPETQNQEALASGGETIWVSPMHPHIRQNEPGQCPICGMDLVPLSQLSGSTNEYQLEMSPEAIALSNVMTTKVTSGASASRLQLSGKIQPDEQRIRSLTSNFAGRIDKLFVNFTGQEVTKGQKLATIYSPDLVNAQKELLEVAKIKDRQPALYQAAKEKLRLWKISEGQIAEIEKSGAVETQFDVYADASGIVSARNVSLGEFVSRGSVLFELMDLSQVWVIMDAYESDLAGIKKGDNISFQAAAYPGKEFTGKVSYIDPILNPETRTVGIRAEAVNTGMQLKPEMFVSATIKTSATTQSGLMVPKSAILWTGPRSVVYVQVGDSGSPAFEMREVTLGARSGDDYMVTAGINDGDEVVSNGVFAIDAAAQLSGKYSMMLRPEAKAVSQNQDVPEEFRKQLTSFVKSYFSIKNALTASDVASAQSAVTKSKASLTKVEMGLLDQKSHDVWMGLLKPIQGSLDKIQSTKDVEVQRSNFETLSDNLISAVAYFGVEENTIYKQYCPMAFKDKGAFWLSGEKKIRNPYFGEAMLTCGEVKETYNPVN